MVQKNDPYKRLTLLEQHQDSKLWWAEYRSPQGDLDPHNAHYFLQLRGSYAECGYAYGYLMAEQILATAVDTRAFFATPAEWSDIVLQRVLPNIPPKYQAQVDAYVQGIIARRGTLSPLSRGDVVLHALSMYAPGWEIVPLLVGGPGGGHSTADGVFGSHTRDSRERGGLHHAHLAL